jgi:malyl-CoA/(S)-citramalyl-CoA lyase
MKVPRLQRSVLAVPVTSRRFVDSAARSPADAVFLDLEDAVAPSRKEEARALAIQALNEVKWGSKLVTVRINEIASPWGYRDVIDIAERCPRLDTVLVPKVAHEEDVRFIERLLNAIEVRHSRNQPIGIEALIESPQGLANVERIAAASARLESLMFGVGDYSVGLRVPQTEYGIPDPDYGVLTNRSTTDLRTFHWNDQWHYALARIANACRANDLRPIDGPFTALDDSEGYVTAARRSRALGFEGKWAIHPSQLRHANSVFVPSVDELTWARRVSEALSDALAAGHGAARLDGRMVDLAHIRHAEILHSRQQMIARSSADLGK